MNNHIRYYSESVMLNHGWHGLMTDFTDCLSGKRCLHAALWGQLELS